MANSKIVYSGKQWRVGILAQSAFGTIKASSSNFVELPVMDVSMPSITTLDGGGIRSGTAGMITHDDSLFRTEKGGEITWSFEMPCEREWAAQMLASVFQDHAQDLGTRHTITASSGAALARPDFGGAISTGIPAYYTISFDSPTAADDFQIQDAILRNLTLTCDPASNEGRCYLAGEFYSGAPIVLEATNSGTWVQRTQNYTFPDWQTKTLDVDGTANAEIFVGSVDFTFNNNASRLGFDASGNAETYKWGVPEVEITGSLRVKYDAVVALTSGENVIQDFLSGNSATLVLQSSDGTVNAEGEYNIEANIYYTGQPEIDLASDDGVFVNLPFKVVQPTSSGAASGIAFEYVGMDGTASTAW
mgnify:CR=1 FL=1